MEPLSPSSKPSHLPVGQVGLHPTLEQIVVRHLDCEDRAPVPEHTRAAYAQLRAVLEEAPRPLILDSGCGTGAGTAQLARLHPEAWVIGVDQSRHRLRKGPARDGLRGGLVRQDNLLLMRGDAPGLWRALAADGRRLSRHYLLYPNPWPKKRHVMRRWHAHPAFAALWALGGALELRTNWRVYADEMQLALRTAGEHLGHPTVASIDPWAPEIPLSPFEAKYVQSGHALLRLEATLPSPGPTPHS